MVLAKEVKKKVIAEYKRSKTDSGSAEVQVAILTTRINDLAPHFKKHGKDHHSRHGLLKMVGKRKRLLQYLKDTDPTKYKDLIARLNLRK